MYVRACVYLCVVGGRERERERENKEGSVQKERSKIDSTVVGWWEESRALIGYLSTRYPIPSGYLLSKWISLLK